MKKDSGREMEKDSARQTEFENEGKLVKRPFPDVETLKKHVLGVDSYDFFFFETRVREMIAE